MADAPMTDVSVARVAKLLSELVEVVETARVVPMSASCVVPREHVLDLLDAVREALPSELDAAHRVVAQRDALLVETAESSTQVRTEAEDYARQVRDDAGAQADAILADARHQAAQLVRAAEEEAYRTVESARAEHAALVSATTVHRNAHGAATRLHSEADEYAAATRTAADRYAVALRADAEGYADRTLLDLVGVLQRAMATAEQGRQALAARRNEPTSPSPDVVPAEPEPGGSGPSLP
jgi:cell division septum initiation protein DivIVA